MKVLLKQIKQDWLCGVVMLLVLIMLLSLWLILMEQEFCAFDDMPYLSSYIGKLATEGRWINYLIFHATKHINHTVAQYFNVLCLSCFCCCVARKYCSLRYSIIVTLFSLLSLSFWYVSECPVTTMTMYLFTAIAAFVHDKMDKRIFFLIFGILYGGVVPPMYFLLPLLFLKESNQNIVKVVVYWILGYLVGFAVAELATYVRCGHLIEVASWRHPNYITDWKSMYFNVCKEVKILVEHVRLMNWPALGCFIAAIVAHMWNYRGNVLRGGVVFLVFMLVILSSYALGIATGIDIPVRTSWGLYLGGALFIALSFRRYKYVQAIVLLLAASSFFVSSFRVISDKNVAQKMAKVSWESTNMHSAQVREVVILSHGLDAWSKKMNGIDRHTLLEPMLAMGIKRCGIAGEEYLERKKVDEKKLKYSKGVGFYYALCNGILIMRIDESFFA